MIHISKYPVFICILILLVFGTNHHSIHLISSLWQERATYALPTNPTVKWTTPRMWTQTGRSTWKRARHARYRHLSPPRMSRENGRAKSSSNPSWWRSSVAVSNRARPSGSSWTKKRLTPLSRCSRTLPTPLNWTRGPWRDSILWRVNK